MDNFKIRPLAAILASAMLLAACNRQSSDELMVSAKSYLEKNQVRSAIIQLRNVLQKDSNSGEARFLLGRALLEIGDTPAASEELRKAAELKYSQTLVFPELARALNAEGQYQQTTDRFRAAELTDSRAAADLKTSLAVAFGLEGNIEQRDRSLAEALKLSPDFTPALILQARNAASLGDFKTALRIARQLVERASKDPAVWQLQGDLLLVAQSDPGAAVEAYRRALALKSDLVAAHSAIIAIDLSRQDVAAAQQQLDSLKKLLPNHPQTLYFQARIALEQRDLVGANQLAQQLLAKAPDDVRVLELCGAVSLQTGAYAQAERSVARALQLAPANVGPRRLLAQIYLRSGQNERAQATLAPLLDRPEPDAATLTLAAEIASRSGDGAKAEALLLDATRLNPDDAKGRTALALTQLSAGRVGSALGDLQTIAAADDGTSADLAMIGTQLQRKDLDGALRAIDALERKQPGQPLAASLRGRVQLARHDVAAARQSFERALVIDPAYFPAVDSLAALDRSDGHPQLARKRFEGLLARDPHTTNAMLALAALDEGEGGSHVEEASLLYANAVKASPNREAPRLALIDHLIRKKDLKTALVTAQDAVSALPDSEALQDALGRVQMASGDLNQAVSTFEKQVTLRPNSVAPHLALANVYAAQNNDLQAVRSLQHALAIEPDQLAAQQKLIGLELKSGQVDEALAVARTVQSQRPDEAAGFLFEGDVHTAGKHWEAATLAYRRGLKATASTELAVRLHTALLAAGQAPEAERLATAWTHDHPKDAAFLSHLGDVALQQGKLPVAAANYRAASEASPDNPVVMNNLAWVMAKLNQPGALALAEKASRLQPDQAAFADTLAAIQAGGGQFEKAIATQKRALELQPESAAYRMNLARIYLQAGAKGLAKTELQGLATLGNRSGNQAEVQQLLGTL